MVINKQSCQERRSQYTDKHISFSAWCQQDKCKFLGFISWELGEEFPSETIVWQSSEFPQDDPSAAGFVTLCPLLICDFMSAASPAWLDLCAVPESWAGSIHQLSCFLRLPWQFLQLCSSSFPVPLPLWAPSGSVFIDLLRRFCLSSSQNRLDIQKPLLISCWKTCASFQPQFSLIWHHHLASSSSKALHVVPAFLHKLANPNLILGLGEFCLTVLVLLS